MLVLSENDVYSIVSCTNDNVFAFLGAHEKSEKEVVIRNFSPNAESLEVIDYVSRKKISAMRKIHNDGLFEIEIPKLKGDRYLLRAKYHNGTHEFEDPYRLGSSIDETDLYLYGEGTHEKAYHFLGAHPMTLDGVKGVRFAVWAPNAQRVSVVGDFNFWDGRLHVMRKHIPSGVWEIFIPGVDKGACYKYEIRAISGEMLPHKADPFGFFAQVSPEQASKVEGLSQYQWRDQDWQGKKAMD